MPPPLKRPQPLRHDAGLRDIVAYNIRLRRIRLTLSQEDLALSADLDRTYVSAIERGRWNISLSNIERLAVVLDVEPWKLLKPPATVVWNGSKRLEGLN